MIKEILTDKTNIIEIYIMNTQTNQMRMNLNLDNIFINKIKRKFKLTRETTFVYFNKDNLSYIYDLSNDSQYVYMRKLENSQITTINNYDIYGIAYNEMKMQPYLFGCANDIENREEIKILEFKINNRISIIIRNNNLYISYRHSKDVDIEKTEEIINSIVKKIIF
jgi:hypothetical protein